MVAALYRRYRPETFAEMIGQSQVTDPLMTALRTNRVNHAYLFSGPRGCGKTTSARILARCLNCAQGPTDIPCGVCDSCVELSRDGQGSLDVVEIDAASHNGVDDARDLRERAIFAPARDRFKIFILDEAHMVTPQGFNALLKIVEEPPEHVKFIFATTEPDKVIGTIRSRTHHYPFRLVPPAQMLDYTQELCEREKVGVAAGVLPLVVRAGGGSVRDTLSLLDQLMAGSEDETVEYERAVALLGYTHGALLDEVVDALAEHDSAEAFGAVDRVIQTGQDPRRFVEDLLEKLRDLIVVAATGGAASAVLRGVSQDELDRMAGQSRALGLGELSRIADIVNDALTEMTGATSPRLHLELMIARTLVHGAGASAAPASVVVPAPQAAPAQARPAADSRAPESRVPESRSAASRAPETRNPASRAPETRATDSRMPEPHLPSHAATPESVPESIAAAPRGETPVVSPASVEAGSGAPDAVPSAAADASPADSTPADTAASRPAAPAPATHASAADEPGGVTLQRMKDSWPEILEVVQKARMTAWLVAYTAQVRALKDDVLTLSFPSQNDVDSFKMAGSAGQPGVSEHLRQAIQQVLGLRVKYIARVEPRATAPEAERAAVEATPPPAAEQAAAEQPAAAAAPSDPDEWATVAIPADPAPAEVAAEPAIETVVAPEPTDVPVLAPSPRSAPVVPAEEPPVRPAAASATTAEPSGDEPPFDEEPPEEDMPPVEPPMPDSWAVVAPPGEPTAPPAPVAPAPVRARERPEPAPRPVTRTTRSATADGRQRYGEAVVREILGAQFIEEQPHVPRGPRVTGG
ncbi:DNA polymerase III subunit gamma and tau [Rathayibacter festucae]|uniref:DNA polymerase III subunit gamma and tau n=1 Tax=Rathayibacter festucae TaxID=110937 RepID=UPI002A69C7ED|nr:DNA polymerase III subunit gamma and tau [Rathayibacter festucae]MDY0914923.1 DNA polymerase III subunit gamma and tau [Rathayibacter festucae]